MISSIHLKNIATYDAIGVKIVDLKKINFIYGSNGSGKTTLTNYVFEPTAASFKDCSTVWQHNLPITSLVYNKEFRERNFGKSNIDGVFTLGEATKEETEHIEKIKVKRKKVLEDGATKKKTLEGMLTEQAGRDQDFKEEVWVSIYKKYEHDFKDVFRGFLSKESFKNKLIQEYHNDKGKLLSLEELKDYAKTILGDKPTELIEISIPTSEEISELEKDKIWGKKILGKTDVNIAALIQSLNMNDWINQGKKFIQNNNDICPFCQQPTITEGFRKQLEDYFDQTFISDISIANKNVNSYMQQASNLSNLLQLIEATEKVNPNVKLDLDLFSAYLKTLNNQLQSNIELVNTKIKEPSRQINLVSTKEQLQNITELIENANKFIFQHNKIVSNYEKAKSEMIQNVWQFVKTESNLKIENYIKRRNNLQKGINSLQKRVEKLREDYKSINKEVIALSKKVTSVQPSVDQINSTLKSYGFHNFLIVPSIAEANKYQIQREDGEMAEATLSEGEITFITFLYFLQLTKGSTAEANISDDRILIIDDPISSLDSGILFVISSLIKEIIKDIKEDRGNIKQMILLTHNVYFHKEVSFINGRTKECSETKYWILRRYNQSSTIQCFDMKNPIQNSYELLWKELKNRENCSGITIQNTMRRIIENYFKILGRFGDDDLINKFENMEERDICRSLLYWINDGSHTIPDDLYIERQDDIIDKYFEVFKKVFVYTKHLEHFKMMMGEAA